MISFLVGSIQSIRIGVIPNRELEEESKKITKEEGRRKKKKIIGEEERGKKIEEARENPSGSLTATPKKGKWGIEGMNPNHTNTIFFLIHYCLFFTVVGRGGGYK